MAIFNSYVKLPEGKSHHDMTITSHGDDLNRPSCAFRFGDEHLHLKVAGKCMQLMFLPSQRNDWAVRLSLIPQNGLHVS